MPRRTLRSHLLSVTPAWCVLACAPGSSAGYEPGTTGTGDTGDPTDAGPTEPTSTSSGAEPSTGTTGEPATMTSSGSSESTGAVAMCGDGMLDEGEQCDQGEGNANDGACTLDCEAAVCGDGLVQTGVEECDDAADNGNHYAGCSHSCTYNSTCGDGILDILFEDCDYAEDNGTGEGNGLQGPCSSGCKWDGRMVFMTSVFYDGDLRALHAEAPGGLEAADKECQTRAFWGGLQGWETYRAWLSDGEQGPLDRFASLPVRPLLLPNGELVATSLSELVVKGPGEGIRVDEFGAPLPPSLVWTNTGITGELASEDDHCDGWGAAAWDKSAAVGRSHVPHEPEDAWKQWQEGMHWTLYLAEWACDEVARLYCFEQ